MFTVKEVLGRCPLMTGGGGGADDKFMTGAGEIKNTKSDKKIYVYVGHLMLLTHPIVTSE